MWPPSGTDGPAPLAGLNSAVARRLRQLGPRTHELRLTAVDRGEHALQGALGSAAQALGIVRPSEGVEVLEGAGDQGPRQVGELVGRRFSARLDGTDWPCDGDGFFPTGRKPVLRLTTRQGHALRLTADHPVARVTGRTRWRIERSWTPAGDLRPGDEIVLADHRAAPSWDGRWGEAEGYLLGLLVGDGTLKSDKAVLSAWPGRRVVNGDFERPGVAGIMAEAERAARSLPHRSDFAGWMSVADRGEVRMATGRLRTLAAEAGMTPGNKTIGPEIERGSSEFARAFLRGLFDADGSVQGSQSKGGSVRLAQGDATSARECFRRLVYLVPEHEAGLLQLALLSEEDGDHAAAERYRDRARRAASREADA